ncbi:unnamed protein product, partial [Pylaiella littoralis]
LALPLYCCCPSGDGWECNGWREKHRLHELPDHRGDHHARRVRVRLAHEGPDTRDAARSPSVLAWGVGDFRCGWSRESFVARRQPCRRRQCQHSCQPPAIGRHSVHICAAVEQHEGRRVTAAVFVVQSAARWRHYFFQNLESLLYTCTMNRKIAILSQALFKSSTVLRRRGKAEICCLCCFTLGLETFFVINMFFFSFLSVWLDGVCTSCA